MNEHHEIAQALLSRAQAAESIIKDLAAALAVNNEKLQEVNDLAHRFSTELEAERAKVFNMREMAAATCEEMEAAARDVATRDRECERMHLHAATACMALATRIRAIVPVLCVLFFIACGTESKAVVTVLPDSAIADLVREIATDLNEQAKCDLLGVSAATGATVHPLVVDAKWLNESSFPARRACFGGLVDGKTIRMLGVQRDATVSADTLPGVQWESALYHQLGHVLGLEHGASGIMNYATNGDHLEGVAARKSLLDSLNARGLYPCFSGPR